MAGVYSSLDNSRCRDGIGMIWKINGLSVQSGPGFQVSGEVGENILEYFEETLVDTSKEMTTLW